MPALISAFTQLRVSGQLVTTSGARLQVGSDNTLMVRDSGNFASAAGLAATGQSAWISANGAANTLSGQLTQTGVALTALNLATSGALAALISANAAGVGSINGLSGSVVLGSASPGVSFVPSGTSTIYLSGAASAATLTGLSGQIVTDFATKVQLTNTGVALIANDLLVSGWLTTGIFNTGAAAVAYANTIGANTSGALTQSGIALMARDLLVSGWLATGIANTGQAAWVSANGAANTLSGNATLTGQALGAKIDALSGFYTGSFLAYITALPTGSDVVLINHLNCVFPSIPKVTFTMEMATSNVFYSSAVSGRTTSGFYALFSDILAETGLSLDVFVRL